MSEYGIERVEVVPLVSDATQPTPVGAAPLGALVAVYGDPIDGGSPVYDLALGYCVWRAGITADDFLIEGSDLVVESGSPITES